MKIDTLVKISADNILQYFSYFSQKIDFDISCKLSISMKCQSLFSGKNKKNISLSSADDKDYVKYVILKIWLPRPNCMHSYR